MIPDATTALLTSLIRRMPMPVLPDTTTTLLMLHQRDLIIKLNGGKVEAFGVLHSATPGNDYCNGYIAPMQSAKEIACMCDCIHVDDLAAILAENGLDKRPAGK